MTKKFYEEFTDEEDEVEYSFDEEATLHLDRIKREIRYCLEKFFTGKRYYCGGPLPMQHLLSDTMIDFVGRMGLCPGLHLIGKILERTPPGVIEDENVEVSWDIYMANEMVSECHRCGVPSDYQSGTILLYMKYCHGIIIPDFLECLAHEVSEKDEEEYWDDDSE